MNFKTKKKKKKKNTLFKYMCYFLSSLIIEAYLRIDKHFF